MGNPQKTTETAGPQSALGIRAACRGLCFKKTERQSKPGIREIPFQGWASCNARGQGEACAANMKTESSAEISPVARLQSAPYPKHNAPRIWRETEVLVRLDSRLPRSARLKEAAKRELISNLELA
jgi:hypothetical protein